jgi:hypothetical protein
MAEDLPSEPERMLAAWTVEAAVSPAAIQPASTQSPPTSPSQAQRDW